MRELTDSAAFAAMNDRLILFTASYPFGPGEQFIETELPVLSRFFREIVIQPMTYNGSHPERETPRNVQVNEPILPENRYFKMLTALPRLFSFSDLRRDFVARKVYLSTGRFQRYLVAVTCRIYLSRLLEEKGSRLDGILYFYWGAGAAFNIAQFKAISEAQTVVRLHGSDLYEEINSGYIPLQDNTLRHADTICPVSDFGKRYLENKYPEHSEKIVVSRLGTNDCGPGPFMPRPGKLVLVSCADLIPIKRVHLLASLLARYKGSDIEWHHFGDGPDAAKIDAEVSRLPTSVESTLHGLVPNKEILDFYRANHVDALITISTTEGVPVAIMEAMSFGIPVIATDAGGTKEILYKEGSVMLPIEFQAGEFLKALDTAGEYSRSEEVRRRIRQHWMQISSAEANYSDFAKNILKSS